MYFYKVSLRLYLTIPTLQNLKYALQNKKRETTPATKKLQYIGSSEDICFCIIYQNGRNKQDCVVNMVICAYCRFNFLLHISIYKQTSEIITDQSTAQTSCPFSCPLFNRKWSVVRVGQVGSTSHVVCCWCVIALMSLIHFTHGLKLKTYLHQLQLFFIFFSLFG